MSRVGSILRYPGGKYKAIPFIQPFWERSTHTEYREPFVGGGSVFIAKPSVEFSWINDIDQEVIAFYRVISEKKSRERLIKDLLNLTVSKETYDRFYFSKPKNDYARAKKFYFLNRCSFSGITMWNAYIGDIRYNIAKAQEVIREVGSKLANTKITGIDFQKVIEEKPRGKGKVFLFLDPPYAESRQVVAYHHSFKSEDHIRLAESLKKTKHDFLLTYDDCDFVRKLYKWAFFYERTWTYSVANSRVHHNPRERGNELFISNLKIEYPQVIFNLKEKVQHSLFV